MSRKPLMHLLTITVLGILAYSNTFQAEFTFDDHFCITENPAIKDFSYFTDYARVDRDAIDMVRNAFRTRVIGFFSFALNHRINGIDVTGYHAVNLSIHLLNALLVYWLISLLFRTPFFSATAPETLPGEGKRYGNFIPLAGALLFVCHPVQTGAVTYVVQRFASLVTMFYLLSLVSYVRSRLADSRSGRYAFYALSIIAAISAMLTKENSFTLPFMVVLAEFMFFSGNVRRRLLNLLPLLLTVFVIPATILSKGNFVSNIFSLVDSKLRTMAYTDMSRWDYLFTQFRVIVTYLRLLILPTNQNLDYDYRVYRSFFDPAVFLSFLFLLSIFLSGLILWYLSSRMKTVRGRYLRLVSFGIFWFFVALSVESSIIPNAEMIFEHRVYLPSVGFFMAITAGMALMTEGSGAGRQFVGKAIASLTAVTIFFLAVLAFSRNAAWKQEIFLWEDIVRKSPEKARPHYNLGIIYNRKGRYDEAINEFRTALRIDPGFADVHYSFGVVYKDLRRYDEAIQELKSAIGLYRKFSMSKPVGGGILNYAYAHNNLGAVYMDMGRYEEAIAEFRKALEVFPAYAYAYNNLGVVYKKTGRYGEARRSFESALRIDPNLGQVRKNLRSVLEIMERQKQKPERSWK
ncbi:MAG: tetratricopeptide repeat protein [Nitrospirae bacterium]|nr:tetratricopeptide repeat protein [Nitrospirota bacterium]